MQIDAQDVLRMAEKTGSICFFDLETTNLTADYGSILVGSIKPYGKKAVTFHVRPGEDDAIVTDNIARELEKYTIWVGYYSKMFDAPMIRSRLLYHTLKPLEKRHHLDMYFLLRGNTKTSRGSQGHYLSWLNLPEQKMHVPPDEWSKALRDSRAMNILIKRCESDVTGLEMLYNRTKFLVVNIEKR